MMQKMEIEMCDTECLGQIQLRVEREIGKTVNSHKNSRENIEKNFKNSL